MELEKELAEQQESKLRELLSLSIHNKENPHPSDLRRAAVILHRANELGYTSIDISNLVNDPAEKYSETMIEWLQRMSDAFTDLMYGLDNYENGLALHDSITV